MPLAPVKLFAARYLAVDSPDDDLLALADITMDVSADSVTEVFRKYFIFVRSYQVECLTIIFQGDGTEVLKRLQLAEEMLDRHVLTDECLSHLATFSGLPSERMKMYEEKNWTQLSLGATCGILENSRQVGRAS